MVESSVRNPQDSQAKTFIVIGDSGAGKSSFIRCCSKGEAKPIIGGDGVSVTKGCALFEFDDLILIDT